MYHPVKGGHIEEVDANAFGWKFKCWVPPIGYGVNSITGELEKTTVRKRSIKPHDQYWERILLPKDYNTKRNVEELRQEKEPDYIDPELEQIRAEEWTRRLCGMWFYNNGVCTYITGVHYMYLNWWKFQGKFLDFRRTDRHKGYAQRYIDTDPNALGMAEVTKRKNGKTAWLGCWMYERISRAQGKHGGIQSKGLEDAKEVFQKAIVIPWQGLPHFYRPTFDTSLGDFPKTEMRFFSPSKKGRAALKRREGETALESFIDYKSIDILAYDGPELDAYGSDECGKLKDISIVDRHNIVRFCSEIDGEFKGKHLYTTTVEEAESGGSEFKRLIYMSNPMIRDDNGRTQSGLYTWFLPAYQTLYFDKYGEPDEVKAKMYYMNQRAAFKNNPRELSSIIRKNPFTLEESFRVDGIKCLYNSEFLNDQLGDLEGREKIRERGNFVWKNNEPFTSVEWVKTPTGRWEMLTDFKYDRINNIEKRGDRYIPKNSHIFSCGFDPFKYDKTKDNRRSDGAGCVLMKYDAADPNNKHANTIICKYKFRTDTRKIQYDDALKMAWYFGVPILFERNVDNWKDHFVNNKCEGFLVKLPGETEYGIFTDGHGNTTQSICEYTEQYIDDHYKKVYFPDLLEDWLEFDAGDTTKFDLAMAAGITLISATRKVYKENNQKSLKITDFLTLYKAV